MLAVATLCLTCDVPRSQQLQQVRQCRQNFRISSPTVQTPLYRCCWVRPEVVVELLQPRFREWFADAVGHLYHCVQDFRGLVWRSQQCLRSLGRQMFLPSSHLDPFRICRGASDCTCESVARTLLVVLPVLCRRSSRSCRATG